MQTNRPKSLRSARKLTRSLLMQMTAGLAISFATPALSHHSYAATYDAKQPVVVEGVVTKIQWKNPHAFLYVDAKVNGEAVESWAFELSPVAMLIRYKLKPGMIVVGQKIKVRGFRAKDGTKLLAAGHEVTLADGLSFIVGPGDVTRQGAAE